jgi:uncharacterized repeat protein (TIGR01451 family)
MKRTAVKPSRSPGNGEQRAGARSRTALTTLCAAAAVLALSSPAAAAAPPLQILVQGLGPGGPGFAPGQQVPHRITVTNTGHAPVFNAVVRDDLSGSLADTVYDNDAESGDVGTLSYHEPVLTWTGDIAPGASVVINFTLTVDNPDHGRGLLLDSVSAPDSNCSTGAESGCGLQLFVCPPPTPPQCEPQVRQPAEQANSRPDDHRARRIAGRPSPL